MRIVFKNHVPPYSFGIRNQAVELAILPVRVVANDFQSPFLLKYFVMLYSLFVPCGIFYPSKYPLGIAPILMSAYIPSLKQNIYTTTMTWPAEKKPLKYNTTAMADNMP